MEEKVKQEEKLPRYVSLTKAGEILSKKHNIPLNFFKLLLRKLELKGIITPVPGKKREVDFRVLEEKLRELKTHTTILDLPGKDRAGLRKTRKAFLRKPPFHPLKYY